VLHLIFSGLGITIFLNLENNTILILFYFQEADTNLTEIHHGEITNSNFVITTPVCQKLYSKCISRGLPMTFW